MHLTRCLFVISLLLLNFSIISSAQQSTHLKHGSSIQSIEFSPINSALVASASDDPTIKLWDLKSNIATTLSGHTEKVNAVTFSPDGKLLASGSDDRAVILWDVHREQKIATFKHQSPGGGQSQINSVVFSPDGKVLASAGYQSVNLWDVSSHREITTFRHDDWVHAVVFSPNGKYLASVDGKLLKIWDVKKRRNIKQLEGDSDWIGAIAFSPDSQTFASGGSEGNIKFWSVLNWKTIRECKDVSSISDLDFSQDGKSITSAGNSVVVWSVENGKRVTSFSEHNGWVMEAAFSSDGSTIVSGGLEDGTLYVNRIEKLKLSQGEPNTVRLIYFLPSDRSPQPDIDEKLDRLIKTVQDIYALQMEYYGFGRKTFKFETDSAGKAVVHHVKGQFKDIYYQKESRKIWEEIDKQFDVFSNIYLTALDSSSEILDGYASGFGISAGNYGGKIVIPASGPDFDNTAVTVHELGHAFGLVHDYRNNLKAWVNEYVNEPMTTSFCAAQWLDVHQYFNTKKYDQNLPATIKMKTPIRIKGTNSVRFVFDVTDPDGLHQAQFLIPESHESPFHKLHDFKLLNGQKDTVEFITTQLTPNTKSITLRVIDKLGFYTKKKFTIMTHSLMPAPKVVSIPDVSLASAIRKTLNLPPEKSITQLDMLNLYGVNANEDFDASNQQITNLAGIEHATNLTSLNLSMNMIKNIYPLTKMKNLRVLKIDNNQIKNIKPLTSMTNLREVSLIGNPIDDVSPIRILFKENPDFHHDIWHLIYNVDKIRGPWLWMFVPTSEGEGGARSIDVDSLSTFSKGVVTEDIVSRKGARERSIVGRRAWIRARINDDNDDNINQLLNRKRIIDTSHPKHKYYSRYSQDHSAYALITLNSKIDQSDVWMFVGSDDAIKVWLNGKVVYKNAINRAAKDFQDNFKVDLNKGNNLLMVKVSQNGYKWSMFVGINADVTTK
ncbi:MAG: leucine-rich repeat domain-containing protein [Candidatus Poribacteria bacterium]|nr:leucine-rich repeat domain-containing protein [Candidatus Poribacteria bacterium]